MAMTDVMAVSDLKQINITNTDCVEGMNQLDESSIDSIVSDPPYGLKFMNKQFDDLGEGAQQREWHKAWLTEAYRVLKPGGHLLAFGGSRTYHHLASAVEEVGFEVRDQIMWIYGSGFPKSHNISKAIDKAAGAERERIKGGQGGENSLLNARKAGEAISDDPITAAAAAAAAWDGWGTALKPAHEPIVVARKPIDKKCKTVAKNVVEHGTGGLNIDGCRVETEESWSGRDLPDAKDGVTWGGKLNSSSSSSHELGRWPANIILDKEAGEMLDEQSGTLKSGKPSGKRGQSNHNVGYADVAAGSDLTGYGDKGGASRFFYCPKAGKKERNAGLDGFEEKEKKTLNEYRRSSEVRTASKSGSPAANSHPTVKPVKLMEYLCRLVTPPSGTVLDPFLGSGTTGIAAINEGFGFVGFEMDDDYYKIAEARINHGKTIANRLKS
jgi:DNA modification methylase